MMHLVAPLRLVDPAAPPPYDLRGSACIVLTHDNKILLQQRDEGIDHFPGMLGTFGGGADPGETPFETLRRELHEELGADVISEETVCLGALEEVFATRVELVDVYFWHDRRATITGCYEGQPRYYVDVAAVSAHPAVMDDVFWLLETCQSRGLL